MRRSVSTARHKALVQLLIEERETRDLRQEDVAKKLGQNQLWMARVESGERRIDVIEFFALAKAIGFNPMKALSKIHEMGER